MSAQLKWTGDLQFVGRTGKGPAVVMDNPEGGSGPSPMEMVLMGVAGCTAMDVVSIMKKKRADMTDFQVNIAGERAEEHPRRYTKIKIEYVFSGKALKPKDAQRAIELSVTKYCSATASLNADIEYHYRIVETAD
ncbi:MAG: OsmC family protein [Deltaproteobacteria bacterium]|nr:OsmC family protein [Deltaproteobacteria bacterium]MBW1962950.1 OsmC family protein [Deltaproteobacteria bacterium]MBW2153577.1 OsmC family protein [Deltaproteobacteria bacterium]